MESRAEATEQQNQASRGEMILMHWASQIRITILNLNNHSKSGAFSKLCENIINQDGYVRKAEENIIFKDPKLNNQDKTKRPKILIIDEVDVFFIKDSYGNIYAPSACLSDQTITDLILYIWHSRNIPMTFANVSQAQEYQNCCTQFQHWEDLIKEAVEDLISDIKSFALHDYIVQQDKIGYKEQCGISFNEAYGYKTLFAYLQEHDNDNIRSESRKQNICLRLRCGHYSYAEMANEFKYIMGVTGTLETLRPVEKKIIADKFKITKYTYTL